MRDLRSLEYSDPGICAQYTREGSPNVYKVRAILIGHHSAPFLGEIEGAIFATQMNKESSRTVQYSMSYDKISGRAH